MSNKPARFVSAVCACGASFDREVKRGRPQKWCPTCVEVPFYERQAVEVAVDGEPVAEKVTSEWDNLAHVRDDIEAAVALCDVAHKARWAAAKVTTAEAFSGNEKVTLLEQQYRDEITAVYVQYRGR